MQRGRWQSRKMPLFHWTLVMGDFRDTMRGEVAGPDIVFFDPFSSRTNTAEWTLATFERLLLACAGRATEVFTYSASTAVRSAMLGAGFHVAKGRASDAKSETTIAATPASAASPHGARRVWLDGTWLEKWKRSHARVPSDVQADDPAFERRILEHTQFRG